METSAELKKITGLVDGTYCRALGHKPGHQEAARGMHLLVHCPLSSRHGVFDAHMYPCAQ